MRYRPLIEFIAILLFILALVIYIVLHWHGFVNNIAP